MQRDSNFCFLLCVTIHLATYTLLSRQITVRLTNDIFCRSGQLVSPSHEVGVVVPRLYEGQRGMQEEVECNLR
jgi:hypothetical protein